MLRSYVNTKHCYNDYMLNIYFVSANSLYEPISALAFHFNFQII